MAHLSEDEALLRAFREGMDVHRATASEVFGVAPDQVTSEQRRYAKVINFGLIYGMSAFGLARNLGIESAAAKNYIQRYFERYPGVKQYMDETRLSAKSRGYVETVFGRRLYLPEINSPNGPRRGGAERAAINAPMQGTAADLIKLSMVAVQDAIDAQQRRTKMIMQVHDELVFEVPEDEVDWIKAERPATDGGRRRAARAAPGPNRRRRELGEGALNAPQRAEARAAIATLPSLRLRSCRRCWAGTICRASRPFAPGALIRSACGECCPRRRARC